VDFYQGDPQSAGKKISSQTIASLDAPIDLEPRTQTVGVSYKIEGPAQDIYVVIDAADAITDEITTFNNKAQATLPKPKTQAPKRKPNVPMSRGR
jgi:rRNA processing protein Gar1